MNLVNKIASEDKAVSAKTAEPAVRYLDDETVARIGREMTEKYADVFRKLAE